MSAIGKVQVFNASAEQARPTSRAGAQDDEEISPVASARKSGAGRRHRPTPVTIDLRPDPPSQSGDEAPYKAWRGANRGGWSNDGGIRRHDAPEAAEEPQWSYRANPDAPYRRRTSDETYQAVETVDTPVHHRGGIYDRRI